MKFDTLTPESEILSELGRRLAVFRKQQGFTQTRLAEEAGIGVATLRRVEAGQDSQMETWLKLMKALGNLHAFDALVPEQFASPRARAKEARKSKGNHPASSSGWGDGKS